MAHFPSKEAEIMVLLQDMTSGLASNSDIYPSPPVAPSALQKRMDEYLASRDKAVAAESSAIQATAVKNQMLLATVEDIKENLRYAENAVKHDDGKLKLIGWGGRKAGTSLQAPGQCRMLEVGRQGEGWVFLDWKEPSDGGKTAAYRIQCKKPDGDWTDVGMAVDSEITLMKQERGMQLEYRVMAANKAGEGAPGNTVSVML